MPFSAHTRKVAIALAFLGALPTPLPLTWLHKFYLGQYLWGVAYLALSFTMLPQIACCFEGIWYLAQGDEAFGLRFPHAGQGLSPLADVGQVAASTRASARSGAVRRTQPGQTAQQVASALRELDQLRQEGLMTEYEFEQKRRQLLDHIA